MGEENRAPSPQAQSTADLAVASRGPTWPSLDRRARQSRRDKATRSWDSILGLRRRKSGRRLKESENIYVDRYRRRDVALLAAILLLNVCDAFFTLRWLEMGGHEANPLMDRLLQAGDFAFLLQKSFVVGIWLVILVVHKNFRTARIGLWSLFVLYVGVLLYHFVLHASGVSPTSG